MHDTLPAEQVARDRSRFRPYPAYKDSGVEWLGEIPAHWEDTQVKRRYLDEWTKAVNEHGGFGHWRWAIAPQPGAILDILTAITPAETGG